MLGTIDQSSTVAFPISSLLSSSSACSVTTTETYYSQEDLQVDNWMLYDLSSQYTVVVTNNPLLVWDAQTTSSSSSHAPPSIVPLVPSASAPPMSAPSSTMEEADRTAFFEQKFSQLYSAYIHENPSLFIDPEAWLTRHFFCLCLDHVVPFSKWLRQSVAHLLWVQTTLQHHFELRPEFRNGLIMIFIHTFATMKAIHVNRSNGKQLKNPSLNENMVTILQSATKGLNISFQTIFKVAYDRSSQLTILKNVVLELIELNVIPKYVQRREKEGKKNNAEFKKKVELELLAFKHLQIIMKENLEEKEESKNFLQTIQNVCNYWAMHSKVSTNTYICD